MFRLMLGVAVTTIIISLAILSSGNPTNKSPIEIPTPKSKTILDEFYRIPAFYLEELSTEANHVFGFSTDDNTVCWLRVNRENFEDVFGVCKSIPDGIIY